MKHIVITQRVEENKLYQERRDALDQKWAELLLEIGCCIYPMPNYPPMFKGFVERLQPDGIILTGGNTPITYGGNAKGRDEADAFLISYSVERSVPLLGVCRGMQSLIVYFGGSLKHVDNHVAVRHMLDGEIRREVNSYHSYAPDQIPQGFQTLAFDESGIAEAILYGNAPLMGMMWHPEREEPFCNEDLKMMRHFFMESR